MKLPKNVRPFPNLLAKTIFRRYKGATTYKYILLRKDIYKNLLKKNPKPESIGILIHEQTHEKRIKRSNSLVFLLKFWLSPKFRFREEIEATKEQIKYLKKRGVKFDIEKRARALSGPLYLWCVSYKDAKKGLERMGKGVD